MKSIAYVATVVNAYRMALDAYAADPAGYTFDPALMSELESVSHREYCTGYYFDDPTVTPQLCTAGGYIRDKAYLATALAPTEFAPPTNGLYPFRQHNKLSLGDKVEVISPGKVGKGFEVTEIYGEDGAPIESAPHPSMLFYVRPPFSINPGDIMRAAD